MRRIKFCIIIFIITITGCLNDSNRFNKNTEIKPIEEEKTLQKDTIQVIDNKYYNLAFQEINQMLKEDAPMDFKRAVFLVEWSYLQGNIDYEFFCNNISQIGKDLNKFIKEKGISNYKTAGNYALFEFFTKPHKMNNYKPYTYDFSDFYGAENYKNVFVSKLMETHKGQCRSMPMLYKILSDEIGTESYLALAPNHMYIKHLDEQNKWVNIELTNGNFSSDSWMISSMDITAESIRKGVYMKELGNKESIAFCLLELALAHQNKYGFSNFGLLCAETTLKYFPNCMPALMHKANTLRKFGLDYIEKNGKEKSPFIVDNYNKFKETEAKIEELGFREMSPDNYEEWVKSMEKEQQKRISQSN